MKFPIAWHEECYRNKLASFERDKEALERQKRMVEQRAQEVQHYRFQIDQAKAEKKDGFDREKFLRPKPLRYAAEQNINRR